MKKHTRQLFLTILIPALAVVIVLFFLAALSNLNQDHALEDKQQLKTALTRAAVACYAAEGIYPPDIQYLEDHYGIQINKELYTVKYVIFASNLMPDITVLENQP